MTREALPAACRPLLAQYGLADIDPAALWLHLYEKGEYLCHLETEVEYILFILEGRVKVSVSSAAGRTMMFCFDGPGDVIGSIEVMDGLPYSATAQAVTPVACIAAARLPNLEFFRTNVPFLNFLCRNLSEAFARSSKNSATNILYPLETRLCSYVAMTQEGGHFTEKLTETCELLGTSYRHLLRTLDALCTDAVLQKLPGGGYAVKNPAELERRAERYYSLR